MVNNGHPPDDDVGEAWGPEDEAGDGAWDDGSEEVWDSAGVPDSMHARSDRAHRRDPGGLTDVGPGGEAEEDGMHTALPAKVEAWRRRSAAGAILTGFAFGLQQVFEPKQDDPSVIMETSGEPPKNLPVEADFEYGRPRHSVVNIRPWLLPGEQSQGEDRQGEQAQREQAPREPAPGEPAAGEHKEPNAADGENGP